MAMQPTQGVTTRPKPKPQGFPAPAAVPQIPAQVSSTPATTKPDVYRSTAPGAGTTGQPTTGAPAAAGAPAASAAPRPTVAAGTSMGKPSTATAPGYNPATGTTNLANMLADKTAMATPTPAATSATDAATPGTTTTASTPATPTAAGDTTADEMVAAQWQAIEQAMGGMLPEQLRDVDRQTGLNARRANEMSALGGGSTGGAWGSGQAQAQLGGMAMRQNAVVENQKTQMNMRMSYLQSLADRAAQQERLASSEEEALKARNLQRELQTMIDSTSIIIAQLNAGEVPGATTDTSTDTAASTNSAGYSPADYATGAARPRRPGMGDI